MQYESAVSRHRSSVLVAMVWAFLTLAGCVLIILALPHRIAADDPNCMRIIQWEFPETCNDPNAEHGGQDGQPPTWIAQSQNGPNLFSLPDGLALQDEGSVQFTNRLDPTQDATRDHAVVDPASGTLTFTLPLPYSFKGRTQDIKPELIFMSNANRPGSTFGHFWSGSWEKLLVVEYSDATKNPCADFPKSSPYLTWLSAASEIMEHDGSGGTHVWINRDAMNARGAFQGRAAMGLPSGNLSGLGQIFPPNGGTTAGYTVFPDCNTIGIPLEMQAHKTTRYGGPKPLGDLQLAAQHVGPLEFVPSLGVYDEMLLDCDNIQIRHPDGSIDIYSAFYPVLEHTFLAGVASPLPPSSPPPSDEKRTRVKVLSKLLKTVYPSNSACSSEPGSIDPFCNEIRYRYDAEGRLGGIIDNFGREALTFEYENATSLKTIAMHDFLGRRTTFDYTPNGLLNAITTPKPNTSSDPGAQVWSFGYTTTTIPAPAVEVRSEFKQAGVFLLQGLTVHAPANPVGVPVIDARFETESISQQTTGYWDVTRVSDLYLGGYTGSETLPADLDGDGSYECSFGGSGKHIHYAYDHTGCYDNYSVTTTQYLYPFTQASMTRTQVFDWQSRELSRTDHLPGPPAQDLTTQFFYVPDNPTSAHDAYQPRVVKTVHPRGNWDEDTYQFELDDVAGKSYFMNPDIGQTNFIPRDRFQGANTLTRRKHASPEDTTNPADLVEAWTYEPLRNQVRTHTDARGFTTTSTFDYQEGSSVPDASVWGLDTSGISLGLADVNGDGRTDQRVGEVIRTQYPVVGDPNALTVQLFGQQSATELFAQNDAGQMLWKRDPASKYTQFEYYSSGDPDGTGTFSLNTPVGAKTGYLRWMVVDADVFNTSNPGYLKLKTEYGVDPYGKDTWEKDPRGNYHVRHYDEVNRLTDEEKGDVDLTGTPRSANAAYERIGYSYDLNNNKIEMRRYNDDPSTNTSGSDPNDLQYHDLKTRFGYDLLDYPRAVAQQLIDPRVPPTPQNPPTWLKTFYHYDGNGKVIKEVSPEGRAKTYTYDSVGRVLTKRTHVTPDPSPSSIAVPPTTTDDPFVQFDHDRNGNLTSATVFGSQGNYVTTLEYDGFDRRTALQQPTLANGGVIRVEQRFDENSNIVELIKKGPRDPNDATQPPPTLVDTNYKYDERNRLFRIEDDYFQWQNSGGSWQKIQLGSSSHSGKAYSETAYDGRSLVVAEKDDLGRMKTTSYDGAGRKTDEILPKVAGFTTSSGMHTQYDDTLNRVTETSTEVGMSGTGLNGTETPETYVSRHDFDALDRKIADIREPGTPDQIVTTTVYSSLGDPIGVWNPNLIGTRSYFDTGGREVVTRTGFQGTYDSTTQHNGGSLDPNAVGVIPGPQNADGFITIKRSFDGEGKVKTQVDDRGKVTATTYDGVGRITQVTYADNTRDNLSYFREGPLRREEHYDGATTPNRLFAVDYTHDAALRKTNAAYTLDAISNLSGVTLEAFAYDGLARPILETSASKVHNTNATLTSTVQKAYDSHGHVRTDVQSLQTPNGLFTDTVTSGYDTVGNKTSTQATSYSVTNTFDELNRLKTVSRNGVLQHSFEYLGAGHRLRRQVNATNGSTFEIGQGGYNRLHRSIHLNHRNGAGALLAGDDYTYDAIGNELTESKVLQPANSKKFTYDGANRLTTYTIGTSPSFPEPVTESFGLDGVGNWLTHNANTNSTNSVHEYTNASGTPQFDGTPLSYDGRGNLAAYGSSTYVYDAKGRIVAATPQGTAEQYYAFDAEGRRVLAEGWFFSNDGIREINQTKAVWPLTIYTSFVLGSGPDDVLSMVKSDGSTYTLVKNRNGSTMGLTGASGTLVEAYDYSPYGQVTVTLGSSTPTCPYLFVGRRRDQKTGLYFMRARYYSATMGRFMSKDPIGIWGDASGLGNPYAYAAYNPLSNADPFGLKAAQSSDPKQPEKDPKKDALKPENHGLRITKSTKSSGKDSGKAFEELCNKCIGSQYKVSVDKDGYVSVSPTTDPGNITQEGLALVQTLTWLIQRSATTTINVEEKSTAVYSGSFESGTIDVTDIDKYGYGTGTGRNAPSVLVHELSEQYCKQVMHISDYSTAHNQALDAEAAALGAQFGGVAADWSQSGYYQVYTYTTKWVYPSGRVAKVVETKEDNQVTKVSHQ